MDRHVARIPDGGGAMTQSPKSTATCDFFQIFDQNPQANYPTLMIFFKIFPDGGNVRIPPPPYVPGHGHREEVEEG
jgi:hypothetical protein